MPRLVRNNASTPFSETAKNDSPVNKIQMQITELVNDARRNFSTMEKQSVNDDNKVKVHRKRKLSTDSQFKIDSVEDHKEGGRMKAVQSDLAPEKEIQVIRSILLRESYITRIKAIYTKHSKIGLQKRAKAEKELQEKRIKLKKYDEDPEDTKKRASLPLSTYYTPSPGISSSSPSSKNSSMESSMI